MGYAFSRDRAMPFSHVWDRVNKQEVPLNVVWLSVAVAFVMALTVCVPCSHLSRTRSGFRLRLQYSYMPSHNMAHFVLH